jgi:hypothetical protein
MLVWGSVCSSGCALGYGILQMACKKTYSPLNRGPPLFGGRAHTLSFILPSLHCPFCKWGAGVIPAPSSPYRPESGSKPCIAVGAYPGAWRWAQVPASAYDAQKDTEVIESRWGSGKQDTVRTAAACPTFKQWEAVFSASKSYALCSGIFQEPRT